VCGKKDEEAPLRRVSCAAPRPWARRRPRPATSGRPAVRGRRRGGHDRRAAVKDWPRLERLLPEGARRLGKCSDRDQGHEAAELLKPFETYRDYVPALFPGEGGTSARLLIRRAGKRGKPALREDRSPSARQARRQWHARGTITAVAR